MGDQVIRALNRSGGIRVLACSIARLAREICDLQQTGPTVSVALGRALAGGTLMGALLKPGQRVGLKFEGNGPMGKLIAEADSDGAVRGCVGNPAAEAEPVNGAWNVPGIIGRAGFLTVSKDLGIGGEPYRGMVQLTTSQIGDDLAYYLTDSEQVPSAVGLGASLDGNGQISGCAGFLVQALPKADPAEIDGILERIGTLDPLTELVRRGGVHTVLEALFGETPHVILETREPFFRCGCNREKVERALVSLGGHELRDMREKEHGAEVTCEFCRQAYRFDSDELDQLAQHVGQGH